MEEDVCPWGTRSTPVQISSSSPLPAGLMDPTWHFYLAGQDALALGSGCEAISVLSWQLSLPSHPSDSLLSPGTV